MHAPSALSALTALLAALPAVNGMYSKSSPVMQVTGKTYDRLVAKSNHTTLVEFYAPWCGHCRNLQPAYEKAATKLKGLAHVAAVDCDDEMNKPFCGSMGVEGFPTLKIVRPAMKPGGKPVVEDYRGPRTATSLIQATVESINNHVTKVADKDAEKFLGGTGDKVLLFTEKGTTSALLRSVAIDFLGVVSVGQVRNTQKELVERFGVTEFPSLVLVPAEGEPTLFDGDVTDRTKVVEFIGTIAEPNPDPPAKKPAKKAEQKGDKKAEPEAKVETEATETTEAAEPTVNPIASVPSYDTLAAQCLQPKSSTCVLAFAAADSEVVASLSALNTKYIHADRHLFPFLHLPADVEGVPALRETLGLEETALVAISAKRGWVRVHSGAFDAAAVEAFVDAVRMGEGEKSKLPKGVIAVAEAKEPEDTEEKTEEATQATDPEPEAETRVHEEL